jgi:hypothetical protein
MEIRIKVLSRMPIVLALVCALTIACDRSSAEKSTAADDTASRPAVILQAQQKAENQAKDLGFCLAALAAEVTTKQGSVNAADPLMTILFKKFDVKAAALRNRDDVESLAFKSQFETMSNKLASDENCGALKCNDALFRRSVINASCVE